MGKLERNVSASSSRCVGGHVSQFDSSNPPPDGAGSGDHVAPRGGGAWCGEGWGQPVTTATQGKWLQLQLNIDDQLDVSRFRFDLTYRVVSDYSPVQSIDRWPPSGAQPPQPLPGTALKNNKIFTGDHVPQTICSKNLHSCDQQNCAIQSPNYPALYPR